jgi:hypothetical protein
MKDGYTPVDSTDQVSRACIDVLGGNGFYIE